MDGDFNYYKEGCPFIIFQNGDYCRALLQPTIMGPVQYKRCNEDNCGLYHFIFKLVELARL